MDVTGKMLMYRYLGLVGLELASTVASAFYPSAVVQILTSTFCHGPKNSGLMVHQYIQFRTISNVSIFQEIVILRMCILSGIGNVNSCYRLKLFYSFFNAHCGLGLAFSREMSLSLLHVSEVAVVLTVSSAV